MEPESPGSPSRSPRRSHGASATELAACPLEEVVQEPTFPRPGLPAAGQRLRDVGAQGAIRLETELSMETEPVVGDVRDAYSIPRRPCHPEWDERHRGADAMLPEVRDHGHVDARDAGAEEEGGRGDRVSLPPSQVIPDEGVRSETHATEVVEQSADRGVRHFVSRGESGEPDP